MHCFGGGVRDGNMKAGCRVSQISLAAGTDAGSSVLLGAPSHLRQGFGGLAKTNLPAIASATVGGRALLRASGKYAGLNRMIPLASFCDQSCLIMRPQL